MEGSINQKMFTDKYSNFQFIIDVIDSMCDWVRVLDRDNNIIFLNKAMADALVYHDSGQKCYKLIGRESPCENCISRKSVFDGHPHEKEERINGRIFSVMSSPVKNGNGDVIAVVEVLRDITQVKLLQKKIVEQNNILQKNLEMAKKLQYNLLPDKFSDSRIDFSFFYKPCEMLGGDFFDIFEMDENHIGLYIADVSGHGTLASMLTIFLRSSINRNMLSPSAVLNELYREFNFSNFDSGMYITVFYAIINLENRKIIYSNAGHGASPVVFNKERFELLRVPGVPISNWVDKPCYIDKSVNFDIGDKFFLYTDGLVELKNNEKEQFGEERLLKMLLSSTLSSSETIARISDTAAKFSSGDKNFKLCDDITMALIERIA